MTHPRLTGAQICFCGKLALIPTFSPRRRSRHGKVLARGWLVRLIPRLDRPKGGGGFSLRRAGGRAEMGGRPAKNKSAKCRFAPEEDNSWRFAWRVEIASAAATAMMDMMADRSAAADGDWDSGGSA